MKSAVGSLIDCEGGSRRSVVEIVVVPSMPLLSTALPGQLPDTVDFCSLQLLSEMIVWI